MLWVSALWGDDFSGHQVPVGSALGPCHLWELLHVRSAGTCAWWRCVCEDRYYVLTFGSGGVRSNEDSVDFRLSKLRSVKSCHIACCVHHTVFRLLWLKEYCVLGGSGDLSSWWVGQGSRCRMGRGWVLSDFLLKTFEDGLENFALGNCVGII